MSDETPKAGKFSINFADVQDSLVVPAGLYPVVVEKVTVKPNSAKDGFYLNWQLTITAGEFAKLTLFMMTSLKANAMWRLKAVLRNLGLDVDGQIDFEVDEETDVVLEPQLRGLAGFAQVSVDTYQGRQQNRVDDLLPIDAETAGYNGEHVGLPTSVGNGAVAKKPATGGLKLR